MTRTFMPELEPGKARNRAFLDLLPFWMKVF